MESTITLQPTYLGTSRRPQGWPSEYPCYTIASLVLGLLTAMAVLAYGYVFRWDALQRYYLLHYVVSGSKWLGGEGRRYRLLETVGRDRKVHLTTDWEVESVKEPLAHDPNFIPFRLTPEAVSSGAVSLRWVWVEADNAKLHNKYLRETVYHWNSFGDWFYPGCWWGLAVFLVSLPFAIPRDRKAAEIWRDGRVVRGPLVVTRDEFNRTRLQGRRTDGIGFLTEERQSLRECLFVSYSDGPIVQIPREDEPKHFLINGGTGAGKTLAMMQLLDQVVECGYSAVIHDPTGEYVERFYCPERGDIILNPLDARSPSWNPSDEVEQDAEAIAIAYAFFPDVLGEPRFFRGGVRKILAQALRCRWTIDQLLEALCDPRKIDELVAGTPFASLIRPSAAPQREGMLGELSDLADSLGILKRESEAPFKWTARKWAMSPAGLLFITSTGGTRDALRPLISAWITLLVLWMLNRRANSNKVPVYFFLDEVATLHKLPELVTALTMNRKSNNTIVLGLQGKAQLETIYGHIAETMLAMPWTGLFLKTTEPNAAEWISRYLGLQEIERVRVNRTDGAGSFARGRGSKTYVQETHYRYPVMASQISGLGARQGYLKSGNLIVPLTLKKVDWPKRHEAFIPRKTGPMFPPQPKQKDPEPEGDRSEQTKQKRGRDRGFLE
jgi:Type IV secretion-system coupling protein DNA-binding domain